MNKYVINILCVLVLALTLADLVTSFLAPAEEVNKTITLALQTALFLLAVLLVALVSAVITFVAFVKFVLNVNRREVFTLKNVKLLRKYGFCTLLVGVCLIILAFFLDLNAAETSEMTSDCIEIFGEGFFALLMGEVFNIGLKQHEGLEA